MLTNGTIAIKCPFLALEQVERNHGSDDGDKREYMALS